MKNDASREVVLFAEALQVPRRDREAFLATVCHGDRILREKVENLLRAHDQAGDFMAQSPGDLAATNSTHRRTGEKVGDLIGRYKLLQQIGEGGCGVVFMAEQEEPIRRRVALKIIKPGMDTNSVMVRFEAERQALALMDHPNIAKVLDAGATETGRPYFVMELVRGVKITDYCDQRNLSTRERLDLFIQVCHAIQHAHQKGVIHRDVKPSNILVTSHDGVPVPKVIDFGIAKATTDQRLTDKTLFTALEQFMGTPAYMSPEQAEMSGLDLDTRCDIYSLGVLLYEVLTGKTPFDAKELLASGLDEMRRIIREKEPVRPSTKLTQDLTAADAFRQLGGSPGDEKSGDLARRRYNRLKETILFIRGDLDWIVMKCLEKDRTRRYATANGLALDVERFLTNEPIAARPPSSLYKFRKVVSRHRPLFFGIAVIALLLVASLLAVSASLRRERKSRVKAQTEEARGRQITEFLKNMLEGVGPSVARGRDTVMLREILDRTAEHIGSDLGNQPAVEAEMRSLLGRLYLDIGNYERSENMHRAALNLYRRVAGERSPEKAAALFDLGLALWKQRKLPEAEIAHNEALEIRRQLFGNEHKEVAASLNNLGGVYRRQRRLAEAERVTREGLEIRQRLCGEESLEVADSLRNLSIILGDQGKRTESEATAREMLDLRRRLLGNDDPLVASALADVAWAAGFTGKLDQAEAFEQEAFEIQRKVLGDGHPDVAKSLSSFGERLRQRGKPNDAAAVLSAALSIQRKLLGDDHPAVLDSLRSLGWALEQESRWPEAEAAHREALTAWRKRAGPEDPQLITEVESLSRTLRAQKKFTEEEQLLNETLTAEFSAKPSSVDFLARRADLRGRQSRWQEAAEDAALAMKHQPSSDERFHMLAALYAKMGDRPRYELLCQNILSTFGSTTNPYTADKAAKSCLLLPNPAVDLRLTARLADTAINFGGDNQAMPYFQVCKALSEYRQGNLPQSIEWAENALGTGFTNAQAQACGILAMARWKLDEKETARELLARGNSLAPSVLRASEAADPGEAWLGWVYARVCLEEAEETISGKGR